MHLQYYGRYGAIGKNTYKTLIYNPICSNHFQEHMEEEPKPDIEEELKLEFCYGRESEFSMKVDAALQVCTPGDIQGMLM